jgi:phosphate/sulfate permease
MKTLIGGAIAAALGLIGLAIWWAEFLMVLAGIIPIMLLLGGGLAIYLGFDELKDTWKKDETFEPANTAGSEEDVERYKQEIDELKEEIKSLKKE